MSIIDKLVICLKIFSRTDNCCELIFPFVFAKSPKQIFYMKELRGC